MPPLVETWCEAYWLWDAKDWSMGALALEIKDQIASGKRPTLANLMVNGRRLSLSESSIQRLASTDERIPEVLAELVEELKAQNPTAKAKTRIVEEGLRVVRGHPTERQARDLALALLAHFPTNALALKLADALLAQANGKLEAMQATLAHADAQLEVLDTKNDRNGRTMLRGLWAAVAVGGIGALASMASCVANFSQRLTPAAPVASAPAPAPVHEVTINIGPAMVEEAARQRGTWVARDPLGALATGEMGEKAPQEQWIPERPAANQKVPPCLSAAYEVAINGGCWFSSGDAKPPCGRYLYRSGDKCYRPVAADPQKPVGLDPEVPAQEPR